MYLQQLLLFIIVRGKGRWLSRGLLPVSILISLLVIYFAAEMGWQSLYRNGTWRFFSAAIRPQRSCNDACPPKSSNCEAASGQDMQTTDSYACICSPVLAMPKPQLRYGEPARGIPVEAQSSDLRRLALSPPPRSFAASTTMRVSGNWVLADRPGRSHKNAQV